MDEAFAYCWTDHVHQKLYVGVHKGSVCDGYIASSKLFLKEYNARPQDFTRQILASGSYDSMINFETKILKAVDARNDQNFYNMHNGDGKFLYKGGHKHTDASRQKMSKSRIGRKHSEQTKLKMRESQSKVERTSNNRQNYKHSAETKTNISKALVGRFTGEQSSQYGSFWVTNGTINKKCRGDVPAGYYPGRVFKRTQEIK